MRIDPGHGAVLDKATCGFGVEIAHLFFADDEETIEVDAGAVAIQTDIARLKQVVLAQIFHKGIRARYVLLEFAEEFHGIAQQFAFAARLP